MSKKNKRQKPRKKKRRKKREGEGKDYGFLICGNCLEFEKD